MSDPFKELTSVIDKQIQKRAKAASFWASSILGTITESGGLKLDHFNLEIKDYLVADWIMDGEIEGVLEVPAHDTTGSVVLPAIPTMSDSPTTAGEYPVTYKFNDWSFTASDNKKITIQKVNLHFKPELKTGDRVLVAPVNNGRDFVIISKVVPN